ncbi:MAG: hypothetical protein ACOY9Y_01175 [Bacillota bacterium]
MPGKQGITNREFTRLEKILEEFIFLRRITYYVLKRQNLRQGSINRPIVFGVQGRDALAAGSCPSPAFLP